MTQQFRQGSLFVELIKKCALPFFISLILGVLYGGYLLKIEKLLNDNWNKQIKCISFVLAVIVATYFVRKILNTLFNWYTIRSESESAIDEFIPLFRRVTRILVWTLALIIVLSKFGVNINALIAALGVGSLAIALAAKDTISNIIAGFLIMIDRPYRIGDELVLPTGEKAVSLSIGMRRSTFRAEDGSIIIMPNQTLSNSKIVNITYGKEGN